MIRKKTKRHIKKLEIITDTPGNTFKDWGKRVREIRKNSGLNQEEFSELLDISNSYLSGIERSRKRPGPAFFIRLAEKLGVSIDYILLGVEPVHLGEKIAKNNRERELPESIDSIEDVIWLLENSNLFKFNVMGFASRFYFENEDYIKKTIKKAGETQEEQPG